MNKSRIRWGCKRGLLELDIMLCGFFDAKFDELTPEQQEDFVALLEEEDQDLFRWLVGQFEAPDPKIKKMVELIRAFQQQTHDKTV